MCALGRAISLWPLSTSGAEVVVLLGLWRAEVTNILRILEHKDTNLYFKNVMFYLFFFFKSWIALLYVM